ncbi:hypothetical protein PF004_g19890 [Phytophthora fragariae]|nr:hypothetical protein PF009_g7518 [Phytophthora fragariae]KAE9005197.1 hypothetical protein PF011_g12146 [Phytophthora fragariae]KAE9197228.1 hypothetical protein PF004_g19890 [Phytophthora fragariae]
MGDLAQALLELREVRTNANIVLELLSTQNESRRKMKNDSITSDLMAMLLKVLRDPRASRVTSLDAVRLRACLPHPLTNDQDQRIQLLEASGVYGMRAERRLSTTVVKSTRTRTFFKSRFGGTASIVPVSRNQPRVASSRHTNSYTRHKQAGRSKKLVLQGLQLLFHCEYLVLVEYVECVVPLVFATYKSILEQLPNVVYYPGGAGSWGISALANLLVFSALEIMTFVLFVKFLQRKFSFSPLYQLAFVFETQMYLVQAKLLIEIVTLLQSKLAHFGGGYAANIDRNK